MNYKGLIRTVCFIGLIFSLCLTGFAAEPHIFRSGLALSQSHNYSRTAVYTDQVAHLLSSGNFKTPSANDAAFVNAQGVPVNWTEINAGADNRFRDRSLGAGYLYLTYNADREQNALLHISGNNMVYVNGEPRGGDLNADGFHYLPIKLKKGLNGFIVRGSRSSAGGIFAELVFDNTPLFINPKDPTLPIIVTGHKENIDKMGAVVVVNNTEKWQKNLQIRCILAGKERTAGLPAIPPMTVRKVRFDMDASAIAAKGRRNVAQLELMDKGKVVHVETVNIESVSEGEDYCETFISRIDGSVQYYAVSPQLAGGASPPALFLSVHGAGVEAINQARAYESKPEGVLVAPTNRRPRGFNWEDWGRIDGMEVFAIAKKRFSPDPARIYLTGHSMGGHGTWFLGAHYAGQWAAIAPCAGYPTLMTYGSADGPVPSEARNEIEKILLQASNASNVIEMAGNYNSAGVYIFHGDSDRTVSVQFARQMRDLLSKTTKDLNYYEYPGGSHWWSNESVDWQPLFDYFGWHTIPSGNKVNIIDFTTANPAISSQHYWVSVLQQQQPLKYSRIKLSRSTDGKTIGGTTENIALLSLALDNLKNGDALQLTLDGQEITFVAKSDNDVLYLRRAQTGGWQTVGAPLTVKEKSATRNGTFKEPFDNRMVYVYGTTGTKEENAWSFNKARYDAEIWYYRGNGAVDIVPDKDFKPADYPDRGVILYGNASTNAAWKSLLNDCPIQAIKGQLQVGDKTYTGNHIAAYFMWPRADSRTAGIAVVCGTGIEGMKAADANQYFTGGSGFPDFMIFSSKIMLQGLDGILEAGFFDNNWSLKDAQRMIK